MIYEKLVHSKKFYQLSSKSDGDGNYRGHHAG